MGFPASFRARLFAATGLSALIVAFASCGSRTGLFAGIDDVNGIGPDGGRDATVDGPVPCVPGRFTFELAATQLMLVIDRSGSMAYSIDGRPPAQMLPGEKSRWITLRDALAQQLAPFDQQIAIGAKFFPEVVPPGQTDPDVQCRTDTGAGIPPKRGNASQVISVFDDTRPIGGTPTAEAIRLAAEYLAQSRAVARTMIVATDGAPNCNEALDYRTCICTSITGECTTYGSRYNCLDDVRTVAVIKDTFDVKKIPVYVIGIGGQEEAHFLRVLDEMAVAGGRPRQDTPRHYNVQSSDELNDALESIRDQVSRCTFLTPSAPLDPNAITVEVNGVVVSRDPTRQNGWDWVDQSYGELAFFGPACDRVAGGTAMVGGVVTCNNP